MEHYPADFAERFVSGMADAIVYADAEGVIRVWNRGATRIFGFAEAEALDRSLDLIIPENLRERHWQGIAPRCAPGSRATATASSCLSPLCGRTAQGSRSSSPLCRLLTMKGR
jgi:PAS domain-containing protein